jgi:hypothetical protein
LRPKIAAAVLVTAALLPVAAVAAKTGAGKPPDGLYATSAKTTIVGAGYSNGGVDLTVTSGGRKIKASDSGVACYTGAAPPPGVPTYDEVTIHLPQSLTIGGGKKFSFSGPVTLTSEDAQAESSIQTTYEIRGSFVRGKHGTYKAVGTDSSPICQPSTLKHFTAYGPG